MRAVAAFEGRFKYGQWLPIWVELENQGVDQRAEVQVRVNSRSGVITYAAPADLPTGARKRIPLYVPPNSFSHELEVQLVDVSTANRREVLATQKIEVEPLANIYYLIGIVAPERGALSLLAGITLPGRDRPVEIVDLLPTQLPERVEGLRSFDMIILNDVDTAGLSSEQNRTLAGWVSAGGRLVIGGGAGARATAAGLPPSLLPIVPTELFEVTEVDELATFAGGEVRTPGPFTVAHGETIDGQILVGGEALPLVIERALGEGFVDYVALDLAGLPFDGWTHTTDFWEQLAGPGAIYPEWMPSDVSMDSMRMDQMNYALSMLPSLDLPSVRGLAILLAIYIVLVGPANYLVLRKVHRLHLAWFTIPLITVIFSAGAFGIGYALRGNDLILNKIALITPADEGLATVTSFIGLFSPAQQSYEITVQGDGLLSPVTRNADPWSAGGAMAIGEMIFVQGTPNRLQGLAINQWSMQNFMLETRWENFGAIHAEFQLDGNALVGEIHNDTAYSLEDAVLVWGDSFQRIGDLPASETLAVDMELTNTAGFMQGSSFAWRLYQEEMNTQQGRLSPRLELRRTILDNLIQGPMGVSEIFQPKPGDLQEIFFFAWMDQAPPQVTIAEQEPSQQTTALLYTAFPYELPTGGVITLPPGTLPGQLVELPQEGGACGQGNTTAVYIGRGNAIFDFTIPAEFRDIDIESLRVSIQTDGGWTVAPTVAIYDWERETWLALESPELGVNTVDYVSSMLAESSKIRVRLSTDVNQGGCLYLNLGLKGARGEGEAL
jgi:hypothetical protein